MHHEVELQPTALRLGVLGLGGRGILDVVDAVTSFVRLAFTSCASRLTPGGWNVIDTLPLVPS